MEKQAFYSGSPFEKLAGYARAVRVGNMVMVSGTAGYDFQTGSIADGAADQTRQALRTIEAALGQAGCRMGDIARMVVYLSDRAWIEEVSAVLKESFPEGLITNTTIICTLTMPAMKVELEATAVIP